MKPYYSDESVTLFHGDCLEVMRTLPDSSVDSVVCDPPYGLANTDPAHVAETITRWVNGERDYLPGGSGFMGKAWDAFVPPVAVWDECLRVLKPGGHVLAFAGSRTVDLMTLGLRLAGFEIRESIAWLYGSGFPKSLDVSKAIDKRPGVSQHPAFAAHLAERRQAAGLSRADVSERVVGTRTGACWNWEHHQFPEAKWWPALRELLSLDEAKWGPVIAEAERQKIGERTTGVGTGKGTVRIMGDGSRDLTASATPAAEQWQGWGTALKPAFEPVVVGRKPLAGTVAANVLEHGTGALNIAACRVEGEVPSVPQPVYGVKADGVTDFGAGVGRNGQMSSAPGGRWPTNVVLDDTQAAELDEQSGERTSGILAAHHTRNPKDAGILGAYGSADGERGYGDSGGASRFFPTFRYEAKAPASERPKVNGTAHPTVKPLDLMRWLVRLVTPPGGTVLEPFAGSGTTVEACVIEGFKCVAIEKTDEYLPLTVARIHRRRDPVAAIKLAGDDLGLFDLGDTP